MTRTRQIRRDEPVVMTYTSSSRPGPVTSLATPAIVMARTMTRHPADEISVFHSAFGRRADAASGVDEGSQPAGRYPLGGDRRGSRATAMPPMVHRLRPSGHARCGGGDGG